MDNGLSNKVFLQGKKEKKAGGGVEGRKEENKSFNWKPADTCQNNPWKSPHWCIVFTL